MPARLQLSFSPLTGQPSSLFEEAIYSIYVCFFCVVNLAKGEKCKSPYFLASLAKIKIFWHKNEDIWM